MKPPTQMPPPGTRFPVDPRLAPDGQSYVCDACGREWGRGEVSGCGPCREAIENASTVRLVAKAIRIRAEVVRLRAQIALYRAWFRFNGWEVPR